MEKYNNDIISVIVPAYNVDKYIERCLSSLLKQTYKNLEIILVDDGSTDKTGYICDVWADKYSNIIVIHQKNCGVSHARNIGLKKAHGEYIGFVDPDDYIDKNMYMNMYQSILTNEADVAACTWVNEFEDGTAPCIKSGVNQVMSNEVAIIHDFTHGMFITWNKLFSRKVCCNIFYDEDIINGEDRLFDVMALLNANRVVYVNKPYYHYCHRCNSAGNKRYTDKDKSLLMACEKIKKLTLDIGGMSVIIESQIQQAYMQLLNMMEYNIDAYRPDSMMILNKLREEIFAIMFNRFNNFKFKIKALLICVSPSLVMRFTRCKNAFK